MKYTNNPVVINTLKIWFQLRQNFKCENLFHLSPIHNNHLFPQAMLDSEFTLWQRRGILLKTCTQTPFLQTLMICRTDLVYHGLAYFVTFKSATSFSIIFLTFHTIHHPRAQRICQNPQSIPKKYFKDIWPDNQS